MGEAAFYGALAASSLSIGALLALGLRPSNRAIGLVLAFGAGALISAVAYELVPDAVVEEHTRQLGLGMGAGALAFYLGDRWIAGRGGGERKSMERQKGEGNALAIFLGTLLDGVPESFILGMTFQASGEVGLAFLVAVFVANRPEGMAATNGFRLAGWPSRRIHVMWVGVMAASAASASLGYVLFPELPTLEGFYVQGFAAGALLTMLADSMLPEAYKEAGRATGLLTVLGFAVAVAIASLE